MSDEVIIQKIHKRHNGIVKYFTICSFFSEILCIIMRKRRVFVLSYKKASTVRCACRIKNREPIRDGIGSAVKKEV